MPTSNYYSLLTGVNSKITALSLMDWNNNVIPVLIKKLPETQQELESFPQILVVPSEVPPTVTYLDTQDNVLMTYSTEVVIVAFNNEDLTSHLDYYMNYLQTIRRVFKGLSLLITGNFATDVIPEFTIDRNKVNKNYDYSGMRLKHYVTEMRTN